MLHLSISPDGALVSTLLSAKEDDKIFVFDARKTGKHLAAHSVRNTFIENVQWTADGSALMYNTDRGTLDFLSWPDLVPLGSWQVCVCSG